MVDRSKDLPYDPRVINKALFDRAKIWWGASLLLKLSVFAIGVTLIFSSHASKLSAFVVGFLSIASELCKLRSDQIKGVGEDLCRKLDFQESLGWQILMAEMSDIMLKFTNRGRKKLLSKEGETYFASNTYPSPRRALENLQESAWFSKYLSRTMAHLCLTSIIILVFVSIATLLTSIHTIKDYDLLANMGRVVTSSLMLVFSINLIPLMLGYFSFSHSAGDAERKAKDILDVGTCNEIDALKAWQEYHIVRAQAPLIPTWIWKYKRNTLNELWRKFRT
jgi:hypothetical protein